MTNIKEATQQWVNGMSAFPSSLLERAYFGENGNFGEDFYELTPVPKIYKCDTCDEEFDKDFFDNEAEENSIGDKICPSCFEKEKQEHDSENAGDEDFEEYTIEDTTAYIVEEDDEDGREYGLPMWGWLWNPESIDEWWIRENLDVVANCGFRIYETDEVGVLLGIDGAGYDFYEQHWIPLYKARGLKWHDTEE